MQVGDQPVGLSFERRDAQERDRTAAVFAWLTLDAIWGGGAETWHEFVSDISNTRAQLDICRIIDSSTIELRLSEGGSKPQQP